MKTIYFDTGIYNALVDDRNLWSQVFSLREMGKIEVIFSEYVFNELVHTWIGRNVQARKRTQQLFKCVFALISNKILQQQETIINAEIKSFLDGSGYLDIFFNPKETTAIKNTIERLANGEEISNTSCLLDIGKKKKVNHDKFKGITKKHNLHVLNLLPYKNFEEWYNSPLVKKYEKDLIKKLLTQKIVHKTDFDTIQKVQENKSNLIHFSALLRMYAAYQFALLAYKKPLRGDGYDMKHFVCSATIDILVCDRDFLNMLRWVYPQKYCCTKKTFLNFI
jgi:hypothetical protein